MQAVIPHGQHVRRPTRLPWIVSAIATALAATVLLILMFGSSGSVAQTATNGRSALPLTQSEVHALARLTPAQKMAVDRAIVTAFGRYGEAGTGTMPIPGHTALTAKTWSWGIASTHVWVILSYTDVHNGALAGMGLDCLAMLKVAKVDFWPMTAACTSMTALLAHLSNGYVPMNNHGVWAALYWWPLGKLDGGRW